MFCQKCQRPNEDTSAYCIYCGAPLNQPAVAEAVQPVTQTAPAVVFPEPVSAQPVQPLPEHPVIGRIKALASSTLFLVAVIAFTVAAVLGVVASVSSQNELTAMMNEYFSPGMEDDLAGLWQDEGAADGQEYTYSVEFGNGFALAGMLPSIAVSGLSVAALWMLYAAGKNRKIPGMKTGGLTVLEVMNILSLVVIGLVTLLMLLMGLLLAVTWDMIMAEALLTADWAGDPAELSAIVSAVFVVLFVFLVLMMAFMVLYQVKVVLLISKAKKTVMSGVPVGKGSLFVAVMCYISGGFSAVGAVFAVLSAGIFGLLAGAAQAVSLIAFGMVAMRYRTLMQELQFVMNQPPVPYVFAQHNYGVPAPGNMAPPAVPTAPVETANDTPLS
ncbi:MAG: zinc ribbon domain-containing protein [Clostridia bacterium]|nr:zinc ribbon domain-containing protein [Clostridia bacterium]